jgi:hypothetical protein
MKRPNEAPMNRRMKRRDKTAGRRPWFIAIKRRANRAPKRQRGRRLVKRITIFGVALFRSAVWLSANALNEKTRVHHPKRVKRGFGLRNLTSALATTASDV